LADGIREFYVGDDWESASDKDILNSLGYDHKKYHIVKREDGPSGGGGDNSAYITIDFGATNESEELDD
jgi:hypothetical protein